MPYLRLRRTGAAVAGALLMIVTRAISPADALRAIDLRTIVLLFVMMAVVAPLRMGGTLTRAARAVSTAVRHPAALLAVVIVASGLLSAIFINDTVCVVFTPVVLELAAVRRHRPLPYLIALATASNIGSVATIVGNPQNILIGSVSRVGVWTFTRSLAPIALVGFAIDLAVIWALFRDELHKTAEDEARLKPSSYRDDTKAPLRRSPYGRSPKVSAERSLGLGCSAKALAEPSLAAIDWKLLILFVALFVVVGGAERAGIDRWIFESLRPLGMQTIGGFTVTVAALSNIVSNVPAVMLFTSLVPHLPQPTRAWLLLAMASTLAGNLTILGSIANLIVVEGARRRGAHVSFGDYLKVGIPVTILTMAFGTWWLHSGSWQG